MGLRGPKPQPYLAPVEKPCVRCLAVKTIDQFRVMANGRHQSWCKPCQGAYSTEHSRIARAQAKPPSPPFISLRGGEERPIQDPEKPKARRGPKPLPLPTEKRCARCQEVKPVVEFRSRGPKGNNRPIAYCTPCDNVRTQAWARANPEKARAAVKASTDKKRDARVEFMLKFKAQPCSDCGQTYPSCVMEFDHVRGEKIKNVAQMTMFANLERLVAEIAKCDLVCANCHRIRTCERRGHHHSRLDGLEADGLGADPNT